MDLDWAGTEQGLEHLRFQLYTYFFGRLPKNPTRGLGFRG